MSKRGPRKDFRKRDDRFLSLGQLPPGSWQTECHAQGTRFYGPPSNPAESRIRDAELRAAMMGKTMILSFANGEVIRAENYDTPSEVRTALNESCHNLVEVPAGSEDPRDATQREVLRLAGQIAIKSPHSIQEEALSAWYA